MIMLPKTKEETSRYLPHDGNMCLIDEVIAITDSGISARTTTHQDKLNPLMFEDCLPAISGIEYAAQTVALHLGLTKTNNAKSNDKNYLAAVQHCEIHVTNLDSIISPLDINCSQMHLDDQAGALYEFNITEKSKKSVVSGKLLIMFK